MNGFGALMKEALERSLTSAHGGDIVSRAEGHLFAFCGEELDTQRL